MWRLVLPSTFVLSFEFDVVVPIPLYQTQMGLSYTVLSSQTELGAMVIAQ